MVCGRHLVDGTKNLLREGNEESNQSKGADQQQKHQQSFQSEVPFVR